MCTPHVVEIAGALRHARELLCGAKRVLVLVGAGLSAEAGMPVFRGPEGLWNRYRPEELATPEAFRQDPARTWAWTRWRLERLRAARPHEGHRALVRWARRTEGVVLNQNVDGLLEELWQEAGLPAERLAALHGSLLWARCAGCGARRPMAEVPADEVPGCACGGVWRPDVVWFGEPLSAAHLRLLRQEPQRCDAGLAVGTSAQVWPAAGVLEVLARRGKPLVVVNPEAGPASREVAWIPLGAREALPRLLDDREDGS